MLDFFGCDFEGGRVLSGGLDRGLFRHPMKFHVSLTIPGTIISSDPSTGKIQRQAVYPLADGQPRPVAALSMDSQFCRALVSHYDGTVHLISNIRDKPTYKSFQGVQFPPATCLEFVSGLQKCVLSGGGGLAHDPLAQTHMIESSGDVRVWNIETAKCVAILRGTFAESSCCSLCVNPAILRKRLQSNPNHCPCKKCYLGLFCEWPSFHIRHKPH